jgi:hypothetical protein
VIQMKQEAGNEGERAERSPLRCSDILYPTSQNRDVGHPPRCRKSVDPQSVLTQKKPQ